MFPTIDLMNLFKINDSLKISENIKKLIDEKLYKLFNNKRPVDPALGETLTYWQYWLHTATIKHGQILEEVVLELCKEKLKNFTVWEDREFRVTQRALNIAADPQQDILKVKLPYPGKTKKSIQIDMLIYDTKNKTLNSYEIKRGSGTHDRQKKEKMLQDLLTAHMHLESYGREEKKLEIKDVNSYVISVFGKELLSPEWKKFSINGFEEIDKHFKTDISKGIEDSNTYFRNLLIQNANKKFSKKEI